MVGGGMLWGSLRMGWFVVDGAVGVVGVVVVVDSVVCAARAPLGVCIL